MMAAAPNVRRDPPWLIQVAVAALVSAALTLIVDRLQFRTPWNYVWIFIAPAIAGAFLNRGAVRRVAMGFLLPAASTLSVMLTGQLFGSMG
jgi:hypothetical protein